MQLGPLNRGNGRELIVAGWSNDGVFSSGQFRSFGWHRDVNGDGFTVVRDGRGIKVVFEQNDGSGRECVEWGSDPALANPFCTQWVDRGGGKRELANWYFDSCELTRASRLSNVVIS